MRGKSISENLQKSEHLIIQIPVKNTYIDICLGSNTVIFSRAVQIKFRSHVFADHTLTCLGRCRRPVRPAQAPDARGSYDGGVLHDFGGLFT